MTGYHYANYTFKYPKLTCVAKNPQDQCGFFGCNFMAVSDINLFGFEKVTFDRQMCYFRSEVKIVIENCKIVEFKYMDFCEGKPSLRITGADRININMIFGTRNMVFQTQTCDSLDIWDSSLSFDTSKINVKQLFLMGSQIGFAKLDLTGVSKKLSIASTNVFDVESMVLGQGINLYIDSCYGAREKLEPVIRYQGR